MCKIIFIAEKHRNVKDFSATGNLPKSKACVKITISKRKFNIIELKQQLYKV